MNIIDNFYVLMLPLTSMLYCFTLLFFRHFRKTKKDYGTIFFKILLITVIIGSIAELLFKIAKLSYLDPYHHAFKIATKLLMATSMSFLTFFSYYFYCILKKTEVKNKDYKIRYTILIAYWLINLVIIVLIPYKVADADGIFLFQSYQASYLGILLLVEYAFLVLSLFSYRKNINKTNFLIYVGMILFTFVIIISEIYIKKLLINVLATIALYVFYLLNEKPEAKLIEQYNISKIQAEKANNAKSEFLSNMSHELRTPLNAIYTFSNELGQTIDGSEIKDINKSAKNLLEIINNILDISKIEANKFELVSRQYSTSDLISEVHNYAKSNNIRNVQIIKKVNSKLPKYLKGDKMRISQIICNLISNSLKYTDKGSITLKFDYEFIKGEFKLIINVIDTGIGIEEHEIKNLFKKFEKLNNKFSSLHGTGLGLPLVQEITKKMNGEIIVESEPGAGSNFEIRIPQEIIPLENAIIEKRRKEKNIIEKGKIKNKKILSVDDNEINLKVFKNLLKEYEVKVDSCVSGSQAIELCKKGKYDLIFLDIMMPDRDGKETLKEILKIEDFDTPVIALTACENNNRNDYIEVGFSDYLEKPINKEMLANILHDYLVKGDSK